MVSRVVEVCMNKIAMYVIGQPNWSSLEVKPMFKVKNFSRYLEYVTQTLGKCPPHLQFGDLFALKLWISTKR